MSNAAEESGQANPVSLNLTSSENTDLQMASVAASNGPNVQQLPEELLASDTSQHTESETLASPPISEIAGANSVDIADEVVRSKEEPVTTISNEHPSSLTDAAEESGQTNQPGLNMTSSEDSGLPTASVAQSSAPNVQQLPEGPLASETSQTDTSEITGANNVNVRDEVPGSKLETVTAISSDDPSSLTDAAEESGQTNQPGLNMTSSEDPGLPTASVAQSSAPNVQQLPEGPLASETSQTDKSEITGANNVNVRDEVSGSKLETVTAISSNDPSSLTDAAEESGQTNQPGLNMTSSEDSGLPTASVAQSSAPNVQQLPEGPLASEASQTDQIEITGANNINVRDEVRGSTREPVMAVSSDDPSSVTDAAEGSGPFNPLGLSMTSSENPDLPTANVASI